MATTTNYSWTTPDDTALVKDGAAAIRSLGTAIDTTVFNNASAAIAKTIVDAKGDIIAATAADTVSRLAVGANDTVLTADSSTATGLKWAAPASSGGMTLISTTSLSSTTTTISVSSNSYKDLVLVFRDLTQSGNTNLGVRINSISGASDYLNRVSGSNAGGAFNYSTSNSFAVLNAAGVDGYGTNVVNGTINFYDANSTKNKLIFATVAGKTSSNTWGNIMNTTAAVQDTAVISSISVCSFDSFTLSGSALLYGVS